MRIESTQHVDVRYEDDGLCRITLNRPDVLNAISDLLLDELTKILEAANRDESRVLLLTGAGRAFCAGGDHSTLNTWAEEGIASPSGRRPEASDLIRAYLNLEKPIIAMVNGPAIGLGAVLALYCDYIVIADDAKIGDRHVNIGLVSGVDAAIWTALVGPLLAKEFMMTGRVLSGTEAAGVRLVNRAVPAAELEGAALEHAAKLAELPPYAVSRIKLSANRYLKFMTDMILPVAYAWEQLSMLTDDHQEALDAFREKRPGKYTGR
jgi:enoyl-CoA hydratase